MAYASTSQTASHLAKYKLVRTLRWIVSGRALKHWCEWTGRSALVG